MTLGLGHVFLPDELASVSRLSFGEARRFVGGGIASV